MDWFQRNKRVLIVTGVILLIAAVISFGVWMYNKRNKANVYTQAAQFISKWEGFAENAMWDVNAWRIGHGSDTITLPDGSHRTVVQGDKTTQELAAKDLARRLPQEFMPAVKKQVPNIDRWNDNAKIAFLSIQYNYGNIKREIEEAAKTLDKNKLAKAWIESTYNDNQHVSESMREALRRRRQDEANLILS